MSITISNSDLLVRLAVNRGLVELQNHEGETVGRVQTTWPDPLPAPLGSRDCFLERVADAALLAEFARVEEPALLFDPNGELVGRFERTWYGMPLTAASRRTIEERRQAARTSKGHTLAEVWQIIYEKYVGADVEPIIVESETGN